MRVACIAPLMALALALPIRGATDAAVPRELLDGVNARRGAAGLDPLELHPALSEVAAWRASQVAERGSPDGEVADLQAITRRLYRLGYRFHAWAEGVLIGDLDGDLLGQWEEVRPEQSDRIVRGDFEHLGVGLASYESRPVVALLFALTRLTADRRQAAPLHDLEEVRRLALAETNRQREEHGRPPLAAEERLDAAAQRHAEDMLRRGYYSHGSPEGQRPADRAAEAGYLRARTVAENIAKGLFAPDEVVRRWMASSGHRRNILSRGVSEMGLGVAVGEVEGDVEVLWVQLLADPR